MEKRGCSMTTCPIMKMPNSKSDRDVAAAFTKATKSGFKVRIRRCYAMLLKTSTRQRQMCTISTDYARQQDIQQRKREQFYFFACTLMSKMDSPAFVLVFVPFHVIWSKTSGGSAPIPNPESAKPRFLKLGSGPPQPQPQNEQANRSSGFCGGGAWGVEWWRGSMVRG